MTKSIPPGRVSRSSDDIGEQLREQFGFLLKSAREFDAGDTSEAKRMAATLRILLHDRGSSRSLLGQLSRLHGSFLSTALPNHPGNIAPHSGLLIHTEQGHTAPLESAMWEEWKPFPEWWNEVVIIDKNRAEMSRAHLVLSMGEQDGGHHVDAGLDATYEALSRRNSLNWFSNPGRVPLPEPERVSVRQISHEVLRTLDPTYRAHRPEVEFVAAGVTLIQGTRAPTRRPPPKPGRNDACPCNSGRKYKKCHGAPRE